MLLWIGCVTRPAAPGWRRKWWQRHRGNNDSTRGSSNARICSRSCRNIHMDTTQTNMTWWQTYSELFPEEFMSHLLLLIGCPAAEAWKDLLPVIFVFGLGDINKIQQKRCIATVWSSQTFVRTPVDFLTGSKLNSSQLGASPVWRERPFWPSEWCWRSRGGNAYSWREGVVFTINH